MPDAGITFNFNRLKPMPMPCITYSQLDWLIGLINSNEIKNWNKETAYPDNTVTTKTCRLSVFAFKAWRSLKWKKPEKTRWTAISTEVSGKTNFGVRVNNRGWRLKVEDNSKIPRKRRKLLVVCVVVEITGFYVMIVNKGKHFSSSIVRENLPLFGY